MVTSPYEWKILERDENPKPNTQPSACGANAVINMVKNNNINNHNNIHRVILGVKPLKEREGKPK